MKSRVVICLVMGALLSSSACEQDEKTPKKDVKIKETVGITLPDGQPGLRYIDAHKDGRYIHDSWPCNTNGLFDGRGPDRCVVAITSRG